MTTYVVTWRSCSKNDFKSNGTSLFSSLGFSSFTNTFVQPAAHGIDRVTLSENPAHIRCIAPNPPRFDIILILSHTRIHWLFRVCTLLILIKQLDCSKPARSISCMLGYYLSREHEQTLEIFVGFRRLCARNLVCSN